MGCCSIGFTWPVNVLVKLQGQCCCFVNGCSIPTDEEIPCTCAIWGLSLYPQQGCFVDMEYVSVMNHEKYDRPKVTQEPLGRDTNHNAHSNHNHHNERHNHHDNHHSRNAHHAHHHHVRDNYDKHHEHHNHDHNIHDNHHSHNDQHQNNADEEEITLPCKI